MRLKTKDFIVTGKNPVTETVPSGNIIDLFHQLNYRYGFVSFVRNDDFHTARGLSYPAFKKDITSLYGEPNQILLVNEIDPVLTCGIEQKNMEVMIIHYAQALLVYQVNDYQMRFYLNSKNEMVLLAYCYFPNITK